MSLFVDYYLGYQMGEHFAEKTRRITQQGRQMVYDVSTVSNMRSKVFNVKKQIAQTAEVNQLLRSIIKDPAHPPKEIFISPFIVAVSKNEASAFSSEQGEIVFESEGIIPYESGAALCLILQDMYPGVYKFPNVRVQEMTERLNNYSWYTTLQMNEKYIGEICQPTFTPDELQNKPLSTLPLSFKDPLKKGNRFLNIAAYTLLVLGLILTGLRYIGLVRALPVFICFLLCEIISIVGMAKAAKPCIVTMILSALLGGDALFALLIGGLI